MMASRKRTQSADEMTERRLVRGWPSAPRVKVRQATAADLPAVAAITELAGAPLPPHVAEAVEDQTAGHALRAGLATGHEGFVRAVATRLASSDPWSSAPSVCLVLVAEHRDAGVVGALVAFPPTYIVESVMAVERDPQRRRHAQMASLIGCAKIQSVAVVDSARGQNIGGSLLKRCRQVYFHNSYMLLYGQFPPGRGLDEYYRRHGFAVLDDDQPLDLSAVLDVKARICPGEGERIFVRHRLAHAQAMRWSH